jgi:hypothetical protein
MGKPNSLQWVRDQLRAGSQAKALGVGDRPPPTPTRSRRRPASYACATRLLVGRAVALELVRRERLPTRKFPHTRRSSSCRTRQRTGARPAEWELGPGADSAHRHSVGVDRRHPQLHTREPVEVRCRRRGPESEEHPPQRAPVGHVVASTAPNNPSSGPGPRDRRRGFIGTSRLRCSRAARTPRRGHDGARHAAREVVVPARRERGVGRAAGAQAVVVGVAGDLDQNGSPPGRVRGPPPARGAGGPGVRLRRTVVTPPVHREPAAARQAKGVVHAGARARSSLKPSPTNVHAPGRLAGAGEHQHRKRSRSQRPNSSRMTSPTPRACSAPGGVTGLSH